MRIIELLTEARVLSGGYLDSQSPLKNSDTIRVYHGFDDPNLLAEILTKGISGDRRAFRRYSYEGNNNPKGLFVSPILNTSKEFGDYIIEFHSRISDLESPVWPSGSFTVQGQMSQYWKDDAERTKAYQELRRKHSESEVEAIYKSDKPEVAASLFSYSEPQALFRGNLNANSIRAVWMKNQMGRHSSGYTRYKPSEIITMIRGGTLPSRYGYADTGETDKVLNFKNRLQPFAPRDKVTLGDVLSRFKRAYPKEDNEFFMDILVKYPDYLAKVVVSDSQWYSVVSDMKKRGYDVSRHAVSHVGYR